MQARGAQQGTKSSSNSCCEIMWCEDVNVNA
jgi:hypothetical protein